jgi:ABC-type multidrug transport system ATPase subunit
VAIASGVLRAHELTKRFGPRRVFGKVSFEVQHGSAVAIVGANGSGKSTLLKIVCGLERPSLGSVEWHSQDGTGESWDGPKCACCAA